MAAKIIENHKIITMEHDLRNEGYYLSDKKQMTFVEQEGADPENSITPKILMVHSRSIDDRFYIVTEKLNNRIIRKSVELRKIETEISEEEIENFETNWELYWKPALTTKEGAILQGSILN